MTEISKSMEARMYKSYTKESFVKLERNLLLSASWRSMSINCKRLIDFLLLEHLSKAGRENGKLMATYNQLVAAGISRRLIHRTITEAETLGLIVVERGGRRGYVNHLNTFLITFAPTFENGHWKKSKDDWRKVTLEEIIKFQHRHNFKSTLRHVIPSVPESDTPQFHNNQYEK